MRASSRQRRTTEGRSLPKTPSGIKGLDEVTGGGLPRGRPTLVCGSAGSGKTLLAIEFLVRGATEFDEPGVFMSFEETERELAANVTSLGFDLDDLVARKKIELDHVHVERREFEETGEYDLEGLFVRLGHAIESIGAKRVVLDTIESLFAGLPNPAILRAELKRLFRWLKDRRVTAIITGERGEGQLTRHGLEEYVSDCVILMDHRVTEQVSTRRMRVVKYRGSTHGTNEYPFIIDRKGLSVLPITSIGLQHKALAERISSGIRELDAMLGGEGFHRGSSVLVSGTAGTGKTSVASHFVEAVARRREKVVFFAFEESPDQIVRNMRSVGIDLLPRIRQGYLRIEASRPSLFGLEMHLVAMHKVLDEVRPQAVVIDPITSLTTAGASGEVESMLTRIIDYLKSNYITSFLTSLTHGGTALGSSDVGISSLIDAWIILRDIETGGERSRALQIIKCRGTAHSDDVREFAMTSHGVRLLQPHPAPGGGATGSARLTQQARDRQEITLRRDLAASREATLEDRRKALQAQMAALEAETRAVEKEEATRRARRERVRAEQVRNDGVETPRRGNADGNERGKRTRRGGAHGDRRT